jgi:tetratricopeptide (TPR) repeat protein
VDYYALIGVTPAHLVPMYIEPRTSRSWNSQLPDNSAPSPDEVDQAALARQHQLLLSGVPAEDREKRLTELEIGRLILRDERRRGIYDTIWQQLRKGVLNHGQLNALAHLEQEVLAEMGGDTPARSPERGQEDLRQGLGYLQAGLPNEALAALQRAVDALPQSAEAHRGYVQALLAARDPLDMGGHQLRRLLQSVEQAEQLGAPIENGRALSALAQAMLARDAGDAFHAEAHLRNATQQDARLEAAWRALGVMALARGAIDEGLDALRSAVAVDPRDERTLLMMAAACLRAKRRNEARSVAEQIAILRGAPWTADSVLRELNR